MDGMIRKSEALLFWDKMKICNRKKDTWTSRSFWRPFSPQFVPWSVFISPFFSPRMSTASLSDIHLLIAVCQSCLNSQVYFSVGRVGAEQSDKSTVDSSSLLCAPSSIFHVGGPLGSVFTTNPTTSLLTESIALGFHVGLSRGLHLFWVHFPWGLTRC